MVSTEDIFSFENVVLGEEEISGFLVLDQTIPFFKGHFPNNPILPAVSIVDASLELLRKKFPDKDLNNIEIKRSKFMNMVVPDQTVKITATLISDGMWKVIWENDLDEGVLAQLNLIV